MAKAYIGLDSFYSFFMWDKKVLDIIDPKSEQFDLVEVPDELVEEYDSLSAAFSHMNERLKKLYNEADKIPRPIQETDTGSTE